MEPGRIEEKRKRRIGASAGGKICAGGMLLTRADLVRGTMDHPD